MLAYRKSQTVNYGQDFYERIFNQTQIYITYFEESHPMCQKLKNDIINTGAKMEKMRLEGDEIYSYLYEDQPLSTALLAKDMPHSDQETNELPDPVQKLAERKIPVKFEQDLVS